MSRLLTISLPLPSICRVRGRRHDCQGKSTRSACRLRQSSLRNPVRARAAIERETHGQLVLIFTKTRRAVHWLAPVTNAFRG